MDHVHPAREPEGAGPVDGELDHRRLERRQPMAHRQIGEHHPGAAVAVLLAVEHDAQRHPGASADDAGAVAAAHDDADFLHAGELDRVGGGARPEEEAGQHRNREHSGDRDDDLGNGHGKPPPEALRPRTTILRFNTP